MFFDFHNILHKHSVEGVTNGVAILLEQVT